MKMTKIGQEHVYKGRSATCLFRRGTSILNFNSQSNHRCNTSPATSAKRFESNRRLGDRSLHATMCHMLRHECTRGCSRCERAYAYEVWAMHTQEELRRNVVSTCAQRGILLFRKVPCDDGIGPFCGCCPFCLHASRCRRCEGTTDPRRVSACEDFVGSLTSWNMKQATVFLGPGQLITKTTQHIINLSEQTPALEGQPVGERSRHTNNLNPRNPDTASGRDRASGRRRG